MREIGGGRNVGVTNIRAFIGDAHDVGGFAGVTRIEDAAQFIVALKKRIGFID